MDIFSESLTPEETNTQFALNEVDNESFAIEQLGGNYPGVIPVVNEDTVLNSMNENRERWNVETGYDVAPELDNIETIAEDTNQEEPLIEDIEDLQEPKGLSDTDENVSEETKDNAVNIEDVAIIDEDIVESADISPVEENDVDISNDANISEEPAIEENAFSGLADVQTISSIDDVFNMGKDSDDTPTSFVEVASTGEVPAEGSAPAKSFEAEEAELAGTMAQPVATMQIDDELRSLLTDDLQADVSPEPAPVIDAPEEAIVATVEPPIDTPIIDLTDSNDSPAEQISNTAESVTEEIEWDSETDEIKTKQKLNKATKNADKKSKTPNRKVVEEEMTEEEEKNSTKKFALILVIVAVVMIFIIGGIIGYLYLSSKNNISATANSDTTQVDSTKKIDTVHTVKADSISLHASDSTANADTNLIDTSKINKDTNAVLADTTTNIANTHTNQAPVPAKVVSPAKKQQTASQQPRVATTKPRTTTTARTTIAAKPKTTSVATSSKPEPLYSIQMYSSPLRSDAEERLVLLARKNISGYITTQQIKGQTWYRVRFGRYATYDEAMAEVQRLDLKDVWIERVK